MADWDDDSPRLRTNLKKVLSGIRDRARLRNVPSLDDARGWQKRTMAGLNVPHKDYAGAFRGERGELKHCEVSVGRAPGVPAAQVAQELRTFEMRLQRAVNELDQRYEPGKDLDPDGLAAVLDVAAWAHSEWIRVHPFANGNGRTARLWANSIMLRYGLPPVVTLRPRPDSGYAEAAAKAMRGEWGATAAVFHQLLLEYLRRDLPAISRRHTK